MQERTQGMTANQRRQAYYRQSNFDAARLILEDPERYDGEESLMVQWARTILRRSDSLVDELRVRAGLGCGGRSEQKGAA
jgi:hypothetical protein